MRIGKNRAHPLRRRPAPGDERSQRLSTGGPFSSNPPKRQHRSSRPPHEGGAFRTRLPDPCVTAGGTVATGTSTYLGPTIISSTASVANAQTTALEKKKKVHKSAAR